MSNLDLWRSSQLREWNGFQRAMDRLLEDLGVPQTRINSNLKTNDFNPSVEISETKNQYILKFEVPGIPKDQIKIELHDNRLIVSGEKREEKKEDDKRHHYTEVSYGSFMRTFTLPTQVNAEKVEAKVDHGVLTIALEKTDQQRARQINIR